MTPVEYDLTYLREGLALLKDYLLSSDLYWTVHASPPAGSPPFPSLTPGGLVLAHQRLAGRTLGGKNAAEFSKLDEEFKILRDHWRTAWERKAGHDLRARLTQWRNFLEDYRQDSANNADRFAYEVRLRVMIDLLAVEAPGEQSQTEEALLALDGILKASLFSGKFIWEKDLEQAFPIKRFWYLYGRLKD
jgi:hypothetical protein